MVDAAELSISNMQLVEDGDPNTLGTLNLNNASSSNQLSGNNKFNLAGSGIPRAGYSTDNSTGLAIQVTPVYDSGNKSIIEMNASGTRQITGITSTMPSGFSFPDGYELVILNNASGTVTLQHNTGNDIYNRGGLDFALAPTEIAKYEMFNGNWYLVQ